MVESYTGTGKTIITPNTIKTPISDVDKFVKKHRRKPTYEELKQMPSTVEVNRDNKSSTPISTSEQSIPKYDPKKYVNSPIQKVEASFKYGTAGDFLRASREATKQGYTFTINRPEFTPDYANKQIAEQRAEERKIKLAEENKNIFINAQGQGFSQNPDTVITSVEAKPFQKSVVTYASGRTEQKEPLLERYGSFYTVSESIPDTRSKSRKYYEENIKSPIVKFGSRFEERFPITTDIFRFEKKIVSLPIEGANIVRSGVGEGLATTLQYSRKFQNKPLYSDVQLTAIRNYGKNVFDIQVATTTSSVGGYILGGASASYPVVKSVISSKPFIYGSSIVTGVGLAYGYSKTENKGKFIVSSVASFYGSMSGFKQGFAKYDPLNPDIMLSKPKLTYSEREITTRLKTNRLIETNKDYISSKRVGLVDITKETRPLEFKFTQKISGRAIGQRSTFVYEDNSYGIIDRYSTTKIFGGRQQVVREYTPIKSLNPKQLAFEYEAYSFGSKDKIYSLASGVVEYPKPKITFGTPTYEPINFQPKSGVYDVELSNVKVKGVSPSSKSSLKQYISTIEQSTSRNVKYSYSTSITKLRKSVGEGSFVYTKGFSQRVSLYKPYTRIISVEPKFVVTPTGSYIGTVENVVGTRNIPVFGQKIYIDKMLMSNNVLVQTKYPSQLSESFIKTRVRVYGNPLKELSTPSSFYSSESYYSRDTSSTWSKLLASKKAESSLFNPELIGSNINRVQIPLKKVGSISPSSSLSNLYSPTNIKSLYQVYAIPIASIDKTNVPTISTSSNLSNIKVSSIIPSSKSSIKSSSYIDYNIDNVVKTSSSIISKTETRTKSRVRQELRQETLVRQESKQELNRSNIYTSRFSFITPKKPIVATPIISNPRWIIPKVNVKSGFTSKFSRSSPKLLPKTSKQRLFILPSLKNVFIYEAQTGKEAIMPIKTKKVKSAFESQYFGRNIYGSPIPVYQKQKYK